MKLSLLLVAYAVTYKQNHLPDEQQQVNTCFFVVNKEITAIELFPILYKEIEYNFIPINWAVSRMDILSITQLGDFKEDEDYTKVLSQISNITLNKKIIDLSPTPKF